METIETLPLNGGHVAVDFVNTVDGDPTVREQHDFLERYADLVTWSRRAGLLSARSAADLRARSAAEPDRAQEGLQRAVALREALDVVLRAVAGGRRAPARRLEALAAAYRDGLDHVTLGHRGDRLEWRPSSRDDLAPMLWPIAAAATELLTSPEVERLKRCGECLWLFLDASPNRSRRWCSMEDCGTSVKKRRYVERRAARRRAGRGQSR